MDCFDDRVPQRGKVGRRAAPRIFLAIFVLIPWIATSLVSPVRFANAATLTYSFDAGVCTEDRTLISDGIATAQRYLSSNLGGDVQRAVAVDVRSSDPSGHTVGEGGGGTIILYTSHPNWQSTPGFAREKIAAHEYVHEFQGELLSNFSAFSAVPTWLIEGSAEYVAFQAIIARGLANANDVHSAQVWNVVHSSPTLPPLQTLESRSTFYATSGTTYGLGYLAVEQLVALRGVGTLRPFLVDVGNGVDWHTAFAKDFGVSPDAFYASFASYRTNLQSPASYPASFRVALPTCTSGLVLSSNRGTVNSTLRVTISGFPASTSTAIQWGSKTMLTITTGSDGSATGSFRVPATQKGTYSVRAIAGPVSASALYAVVPRIKVIPGSANRGDTVNISLRGYVKRETVRIRWKKGSSWVELARVATSNTGSANINVTVPGWAPTGQNSVRGDSVNSTGGRAQTNAFTVTGGTFTTTSVEGSPTPQPTQAPTPTGTPAVTITPTVSGTEAATTAPTSEPTATGTPMPEPGATDIPTVEPTPTETPKPTVTVEPTVDATETPTAAPTTVEADEP